MFTKKQINVTCRVQLIGFFLQGSTALISVPFDLGTYDGVLFRSQWFYPKDTICTILE